MIYLIELTENKQYEIKHFNTEEKFCDYTMTAYYNIVFTTRFIPCFAEKKYIFKNDESVKVYLDVFLSGLESAKSVETICSLFEKIHSDKFFVLDLSKNQK
jgi:hypothetical protein